MQVTDEDFFEHINFIVSNEMIPGLFTKEDEVTLLNACKIAAEKEGYSTET